MFTFVLLGLFKLEFGWISDLGAETSKVDFFLVCELTPRLTYVFCGPLILLKLAFFFFLFLDFEKSSPEEPPEIEDISENSMFDPSTFDYFLACFFASFFLMLLWTPIINDSSSKISSPFCIGVFGDSGALTNWLWPS